MTIGKISLHCILNQDSQVIKTDIKLDKNEFASGVCNEKFYWSIFCFFIFKRSCTSILDRTIFALNF